jgi:uncharacterized short protein YbdD (DUF466 family)
VSAIKLRKVASSKAALRKIWGECSAAARRIIGIPDYEAYVAHLRTRHPDRVIPTRAAFFAERQRARYGSGGGRCC